MAKPSKRLIKKRTPLGQEIAKKMISKNITGTEVCEQLGCSTSYVSSLIYYEDKTGPRSIEKLANFFDLGDRERSLWHALGKEQAIRSTTKRYEQRLSDYRDKLEKESE